MVVIRSERSNVGPQTTLQFLFLIVFSFASVSSTAWILLFVKELVPVTWIRFIYTGRPCGSKTRNIDRCLAYSLP